MNDPFTPPTPHHVIRPEPRWDELSPPGSKIPNIADRFADLILLLPPRRRQGFIARLSQGYFEGWRPGRDEVAALVAMEARKCTR